MMSGNMSAADRAALPAVARLYADNILNEPAIPPLLRDMADEVERLRLTDAEREAVSSAVYLCGATAGLSDAQDNANAWAECAATLRGLLDRTKGENNV